MYQIDLSDKEQEGNLIDIFNEIKDSVLTKDKDIIKELNSIMDCLSENDRIKVIDYLNKEFKDYSFLKEGKYECQTNKNIQDDIIILEDFKFLYDQAKSKNDYKSILINIKGAKGREFCQQNQIPKMISDFPLLLEKLGEKFLNILDILEAQKGQKCLTSIKLMIYLLDFTFNQILADQDQAILEQIIGSLLIKQINEFQYYLEDIRRKDLKNFQNFCQCLQTHQLKLISEEQFNDFEKPQKLLFLILSGDVSKSRSNLNNFLCETLLIDQESISFQTLQNELYSINLDPEIRELCYFAIIFYYWIQYSNQLKLNYFVSDLYQKISKIPKKERKIQLFKRSIADEKEKNDEIYSYVLGRLIFFNTENEEIIDLENYRQYSSTQEIQEQLCLDKEVKIIDDLLELDEKKFLSFVNLIQQTQICKLKKLYKSQKVLYPIVLFLYLSDVDESYLQFLQKLFSQKSENTIEKCGYWIDEKLNSAYQKQIEELFSIICGFHMFEENNKKILLKMHQRFHSFKNCSDILYLNQILENKKVSSETILFLNSLKLFHWYQIKEIFSNNQIIDLLLLLLEYYPKNILTNNGATMFALLHRLFYLMDTSKSEKLECFRILINNIHNPLLHFIFIINRYDSPDTWSFKVTLYTFFALYQILPQDKQITVSRNLNKYFKNFNYNFDSIHAYFTKKIDIKIINKKILSHYHNSNNNIVQMKNCCLAVYQIDEHLYSELFESNQYFGCIQLKPQILKIQILAYTFPNNMNIQLETFNISLAELTATEQKSLVLEWAKSLNDQEKFSRLIPIFFNIIKRGENTRLILSVINQPLIKQQFFNMKALFQIFYNNSNNELKIMLLKLWSKNHPVPMIFKNLSYEEIKQEDQQFRINENLFYVINSSFNIINLSLSKINKQYGKTELINKIFYQMDKFEICDTCEINKNTVDIMFDFCFNGSRSLTISDVHGSLNKSILCKILPFFKFWIIQMDSEKELQENFIYTSELRSLLNVDQKSISICFIVRNSDKQLQEQSKELIETIFREKISIHFIQNLTTQGLDKQIIEHEEDSASVFLFSEIQKYYLDQTWFLGQVDFLKLQLSDPKPEKDYFKNIKQHNAIINQFQLELSEIHKDPEGFYSQNIFPLRSIEKRLKGKKEELVKENQTSNKNNKQIEQIQSDILKLQEEKKQIGITKIMNLFVSIFQSEDYYILYLWFAEIIRDFNETQTSQLQNLNQELHDQIHRIKEEKKQLKKNQKDYDNFNKMKQDLNQIKQNLLENEQKILKLQISVEIFWRELIQQKYCLRRNTILQIDPTEIIFEIMSKGEPFEFLDGDQLTINNQFFQELAPKFENQGNKRVLVISILGPQSSGKSTILNKIFGCHFWTSVGRCTKGIYIQLLKVQNKLFFDDLFDYIVLLDTEGLQNPNQLDPEFDKKIALFVLAISDIILINVKGDIHQQFRNLIEMCIYTLGEMKNCFSQTKQLSWFFNQNNDVNNLTPFLAQIQGIVSNLNQEYNKFDQNDNATTSIDYHEILDINKENIKILGFSQTECSWQNRQNIGIFQNENWRQQVENETFSSEAYNYGVGIIKNFIKKFKKQNELSQTSDFNYFIHKSESNWKSIQLLPDLLEFSELIQHQQNQFMKNQFDQICKDLELSFQMNISDDLNNAIKQYKRLSILILNQICKQKEEEVFKQLEMIQSLKKNDLNKIKSQEKISKKITQKYIDQLDRLINNQKSFCLLQIYEELKKYERFVQEKQGFDQIDQFVQDLCADPNKLEQLQKSQKERQKQFQLLWDQIFQESEKQQIELFQEYQYRQYQSITQIFTEYTVKPQEEFQVTVQKNIINQDSDIQEEKQIIYDIFKQELKQIQFMALDKSNQSNYKYLEIFHSSIFSRLANSSTRDLVNLDLFYNYQFRYVLINKEDACYYFSTTFKEDFYKFVEIQKKMEERKLSSFFSILRHFKIEYNKNYLTQTIYFLTKRQKLKLNLFQEWKKYLLCYIEGDKSFNFQIELQRAFPKSLVDTQIQPKQRNFNR